MLTIQSESLEKTNEIGKEIGRQLRVGDVVFLYGDLGSGKTTFVKGIAESANCIDEVNSPTFVIMQHYECSQWLLTHIDLYRVEQPEELESFDIDYYCEQGPVVIEWPQLADGIVSSTMRITLLHSDADTRTIMFEGDMEKLGVLATKFGGDS